MRVSSQENGSVADMNGANQVWVDVPERRLQGLLFFVPFAILASPIGQQLPLQYTPSADHNGSPGPRAALRPKSYPAPRGV